MAAEKDWCFQDTADGNYQFVLRREIHNCQVLNAKSWQDETGLNTGFWIVLWVAPWSAQSYGTLPVAIETLQKRDDKVQLGIHCFDREWAVHDWYPQAEKEYRDPAWLFLRDGELVGQQAGYMSEQQITKLINSRLFGVGSHV